MAREVSARPKAYESKFLPNLHTGTVEVTGSETVDLGLGHDNFEVFLSPGEGLEDLDLSVEILDEEGSQGSFTITVEEKPSRLVQGGRVVDPTTGSTQATGNGATAWRVDIGEIMAELGGVAFEQDADADYVIHSATELVNDGESCIAAIVLKNDGGTVSVDHVKGTADTTGDEIAPTDAEIQADLGADVKWLRLADCTLNRTADTTVTQSQDNTVRFTAKESQSAVSVSFVAFSRASNG
jgi:hypothetical protein